MTVLGSSCSIPRVGRACSSYLVEGGGVATIFDLGSGAFANMLRHIEVERLDNVIVSHMHADHFLDLVPLRYALRYGARPRLRKVALYLPPEGEEALRTIAGAFRGESWGDFFGDVFELHTYGPETELTLGDSTVRFAPTTHYIPAYAMRCDRDGRSITYSADTAPDPRVVALAAGTDIFLCEATLSQGATAGGASEGHSTPGQAAEMARAAGAKHLVLTHYSQEATHDGLTAAAAATYGGRTTIADDHAVLRLP